LAQFICHRLGWYSGNGQMAVASAESALRKLRRRGLLPPGQVAPARGRRRLKASVDPLPPVLGVPRRVDQVQGLKLHLLIGQEDPLHLLWNDLIIEQHPCGETPLAGPSLRYLIGSDHGWLGALSFGPASYTLAARDTWIGWSSDARRSNIGQVVNLSGVAHSQRCALR
jgi:hypothetical protein